MSAFLDSVAGMTEVSIPERPLRAPKLMFGVHENDFVATRDGKTFWRYGSSHNVYRGKFQYVVFVADDRYMTL